jgi:hypothetical protein
MRGGTPVQPVDYMEYVHETSKNTKGRRLTLPPLRFFEAFSRSRSGHAPRPTPLARTQGRTRRGWSWAESHSRHQRRRHVAQLFPARRAMVGAVPFSPHPISLHFASWIDTLYGGARHHGHSELPQRPPTHSAGMKLPLAARNSTNGPSGPTNSRSRHLGCQRKTTQQLEVSKEICGKTLGTRTIRRSLLAAY